MNKRFFDLVDQKVPRHNPRIVEGYAVQAMRLVEGYIDRIIRSVAADFPPELRYEGYQRCTPYEEDAVLTAQMSRQQANTNRGTFELSRSDVYMVRYNFTFQSPGQEREELDPVYLYLPFVGDAGMITIYGSTFSIYPVLTDKGISVGPDGLFLGLNRVRLTFKAYLQHFIANGQRESAQVIWSRIYQGKPMKGVRLAVQAHTALALYMFCHYGVTESFRRFAQADVKFGDEMDINPEAYPPDQWVICMSNFSSKMTLTKPHGYRDRVYTPPSIRLAIPKEQYTQSAINLIASFFYITDHFPTRVLPAYVDDQRLWLVVLGLLLFGESKGEGKIVEEMTAHMKALVEYMDAEARLQLKAADIHADDIFELLHLIMETYNQRMTEAQSEYSSLYGKRLAVLSYVLEDIAQSFTRFMFKMTSPRKRPLTKKDVNVQLRLLLKPTAIMAINSGHVEVSSVSTPGDNKYFKITSQAALQTDSSPGRGRKKITSIDDPANYLHASVAYVGSYSTMNKSDATGRRKLNPYVLTDDHDRIVENPELKDVLDRTQALIKRRT